MLKTFDLLPERQAHTHTLISSVLLFSALPGYNGKGFQCDFEDEGQCGWTDESFNPAEYSWERRQRGETLASSGPSSDYTTGTASGAHIRSDAVFFFLAARGQHWCLVQCSFSLQPTFYSNGYCSNQKKN